MNLEQDEFQKWLEIATAELTPFAQRRIRFEVETHYAEAVENYIGQGLNQADAQRAALAGLGNPGVAAKWFRRHHLTMKEAEQVDKCLDAARDPWTLVVSEALALFMSCMFYSTRVRHAFGPFWVVVLLAMVSAPLACWYLAGLGTAKRKFFTIKFSELAVIAGFMIYFCSRSRHDPFSLFVFLPFLISQASRYMILFKLHKVADLDQELREAS